MQAMDQGSTESTWYGESESSIEQGTYSSDEVGSASQSGRGHQWWTWNMSGHT